MANNNNGNQFRDDEIVVLTENRDGKLVKSIHPKIGGRLRLAHEQNQQISITTEIIRYDESAAVLKAETTTMKGVSTGSGIHAVVEAAASRSRNKEIRGFVQPRALREMSSKVVSRSGLAFCAALGRDLPARIFEPCIPL